MSDGIPIEVVRAVAHMERVLEEVPITDWHDEWKSRVEDALECRDALETAVKILLEMPGWAHERRKEVTDDE